jgi:hypothetical protein
MLQGMRFQLLPAQFPINPSCRLSLSYPQTKFDSAFLVLSHL